MTDHLVLSNSMHDKTGIVWEDTEYNGEWIVFYQQSANNLSQYHRRVYVSPKDIDKMIKFLQGVKNHTKTHLKHCGLCGKPDGFGENDGWNWTLCSDCELV